MKMFDTILIATLFLLPLLAGWALVAAGPGMVDLIVHPIAREFLPNNVFAPLYGLQRL